MKIAITSGEPAGIGPDLVLSIHEYQKEIPHELVVLGDPLVLEQRAKSLNLEIRLNVIDNLDSNTRLDRDKINVLEFKCPETVSAGTLNRNNAGYVVEMLDKAAELCLENICQAMVTCPIQKSVLMEAGFDIQGHTEYLANRCNTDKVVMMLVNDRLRVALATTHIPLKEVSERLDKQSLIETMEIIDQDLQLNFGIENPSLFVCGLNPHAGESGKLGTEEQTIITPAIEHLRDEGLDITGPLPADTIFTPENLESADAFLAMYHDQGLPVLKALGFGNSVNITLGLPIIRTSVDHGTALSLAGTGKASNSSLIAAIKSASELVSYRNHAQG